MKKVDLTGCKFGYLTAKDRFISNKRTYYRCICDCGNECVVEHSKLKSGHTRSCGCKTGYLISKSKTTHGLSKTRLHRIWDNMKKRCSNANYPGYQDYGGRGITVCDEWICKDGFINFFSWSIENGYKEDLTIDRIDNNKGYSPSNCRWTTPLKQGNNKRNNIVTTYKGERYTASELAKIINISPDICRRAIKRGLSSEEIERRYCDGK